MISEEMLEFVKNALNLDDVKDIPTDLQMDISNINDLILNGSKGRWDAYTPPECLPQLRSTQLVAQIIFDWQRRQLKLD